METAVACNPTTEYWLVGPTQWVTRKEVMTVKAQGHKADVCERTQKQLMWKKGVQHLRASEDAELGPIFREEQEAAGKLLPCHEVWGTVG